MISWWCWWCLNMFFYIWQKHRKGLCGSGGYFCFEFLVNALFGRFLCLYLCFDIRRRFEGPFFISLVLFSFFRVLQHSTQNQIPLYFNRKALLCSAAGSRQPLPDLWPVVVQGNSATGSSGEALSNFRTKLCLNLWRENFPLQYFKISSGLLHGHWKCNPFPEITRSPNCSDSIGWRFRELGDGDASWDILLYALSSLAFSAGSNEPRSFFPLSDSV